MRAFVHVGLAVAIVLVPTLCCCKLGWLNTPAYAAPSSTQTSTSAAPAESCCVKTKPSCCHEKAPKPEQKPTQHKPAKPTTPDACGCCTERPDAAQTETKPVVAAAEPTGEWLAVTALVAGSPEHFGLVRRSHPPDGTGVDARSAALFDRHVMRC
jgi:hypothetical protein